MQLTVRQIEDKIIQAMIADNDYILEMAEDTFNLREFVKNRESKFTLVGHEMRLIYKLNDHQITIYQKTYDNMLHIHLKRLY